MDASKDNNYHEEAAHYASLCVTGAMKVIEDHFGEDAASDAKLVLPFAAEMMKYTFAKVTNASDTDPRVADALFAIENAMKDNA